MLKNYVQYLNYKYEAKFFLKKSVWNAFLSTIEVLSFILEVLLISEKFILTIFAFMKEEWNCLQNANFPMFSCHFFINHFPNINNEKKSYSLLSVWIVLDTFIKKCFQQYNEFYDFTYKKDQITVVFCKCETRGHSWFLESFLLFLIHLVAFFIW